MLNVIMHFHVMYHYGEFHYAECRYAECRLAECHGALQKVSQHSNARFQVVNTLAKVAVALVTMKKSFTTLSLGSNNAGLPAAQ